MKLLKKVSKRLWKKVQNNINLDKNLSKKDKEFSEEVLAMGVSSYESMEKSRQEDFDKGFEIIEKENGNLSFDQIGSVTAVFAMTLSQLKEKYPKKKDFKKALDKINKISAKSSFPIQKLMNTKVLGLFKLDMFDGLQFMEKFEIKSKDAKLFTKINNLNKEEKEEFIKILKENIFKNTSEKKIKEAVEILNEISKNKKNEQ